MFQYTVRIGGSLALAAMVALGACGSDAGKQDTTLAADSALNRDLALANAGDSTQPQLQDVPSTPPAASESRTPTRRTSTATRQPRESRTPSGNVVTTTPRGSSSGGGSVGTIAAGSQLVLNSTSRVCTNTHKVGDRITATVADAVSGSNGAVIPSGSTVTLTITQLKRSENVNDKIIMEFAVNSVTINGKTYALDAAVQSASIDRVRNQPKSKDVQKVATGAVIGAIAGQVLGKNTKSTVIGGAAGAAAGAAAAAATANYEGCVPDGGQITVQLNSAAQIRV